MKHQEAVDRLLKKIKERASSISMKEIENPASNAASANLPHPVANLDLGKVTILNKGNYIVPDGETEKPSQKKINILNVNEECVADKENDTNLVAIQKYFADLHPTPSNLKTSILGGLGTLTECAGKQGSEKLVLEEQVAPQESSRSKSDLNELAKRMREEAGTRVDEKERGHVKQTVEEVLQSPAIDQVSFFSRPSPKGGP